jgi:hypothetical protein
MSIGLIGTVLPRHSQVLGAQTDLSPATLLADTNIQRSNDHETLLTSDSRLTEAAQRKASDMVSRDYWSHNTPDGRTPWSFITTAGYSYTRAGENLAYGFTSSEATIAGWMNSPEHRANILESHYSQVGFGVAEARDFNGSGPTMVVVALYAQPATTATQAQSSFAHQSTQPLLSRAVLGDQTQPVARIQLLTGGQASWSLFAASVITCLALAVVGLRHVRFWHRAIAKSEAFVIDHPFLDIGIMIIGVATLFLSRTVGFIQ